MKKAFITLAAASLAAAAVTGFSALCSAEEISPDSSEEAAAAYQMMTEILKPTAEYDEEYFEYYEDDSSYYLFYDRDGSYDGYTASVRSGILSEYYEPYGEEKIGLSPFTKSELIKKAVREITKMSPELAGCLRFSSYDRLANSKCDIITFTQVHNGITAGGLCEAKVNKYTGELMGFCLDWSWAYDLPDIKLPYSEKQLRRIFLDELDMTPFYLVYGKDDVRCVYAASNYIYLDIKESGFSIFNDYCGWNGYPYVPNYYTYMQTTAKTDGALLTESVFAAMLEKDPYIRLSEEYMITEYLTDGGYISCSITDGVRRIIVDADGYTGKIYSYHISEECGEYTEEWYFVGMSDRDKTEEIAESAAEYYLGEKFSDYRCLENDDTESGIVTYYLHVNGIPVVNCNISLYIDENGNIVRMATERAEADNYPLPVYSRSWAERYIEPELSYYRYDNYTVEYSLFDAVYVDALTGRRCSENGDEEYYNYYYEPPLECPYTDIENSPYRDEIITLYNNGIIITPNTKLHPSRLLTSSVLNEILSCADGNYDISRCSAKSTVTMSDFEETFSSFTEDNGIPDADFSASGFDPEHKLSRAEALHLIYGYYTKL